MSVTVELTQQQLSRIVRDAGKQTGPESLLRRATSDKDLPKRYKALVGNRKISRSLLLGLLVLSVFEPGETLSVTDVGEKLAMSPSTTHRYMTTLVLVGLLEQDPISRRYGVVA